ncbi:Uncharacterised protein [Raoultella terrigena]|uniref:Uncharacterized protein n=1 Tax=Raoultella terrigena TaxID=577 RepID=A0A3P8IRR5_RAOTE|nr:Uncharacterised protein [Raoultella terrigena]
MTVCGMTISRSRVTGLSQARIYAGYAGKNQSDARLHCDHRPEQPGAVRLCRRVKRGSFQQEENGFVDQDVSGVLNDTGDLPVIRGRKPRYDCLKRSRD